MENKYTFKKLTKELKIIESSGITADKKKVTLLKYKNLTSKNLIP